MNTIKNDPVNHPSHYTSSKTGIEVIEVTRYLSGDLSNAWKYLCRRELKGKPSEDLKKAVFYLNDFVKYPVLEPYTCTYQQCGDLLNKMEKFIEVEEVAEVKNAMILIKKIVNYVRGYGTAPYPFLGDNSIEELQIYAEAIA